MANFSRNPSFLSRLLGFKKKEAHKRLRANFRLGMEQLETGATASSPLHAAMVASRSK